MADVTNQRFGISARSKSSYKTAFDEEILVDKTTGEFLIKTPDGNIMSYNYNNRLHGVYSDIEDILFNVNMFGILYDIPMESALPVSGNDMLVLVDNNSSAITFETTKRILFHINIDQINRIRDTITNILETEDRPIVQINYEYTTTSGITDTAILAGPPEYVNRELITFNDGITSLKVTGCTVTYLGQYSTTVINIVNYLGVVVER